MIFYCMSDIHGHLRELDNALSLIDISKPDTALLLLGDYVHEGYDDLGVLNRIIELQQTYGTDKVIALMGNHEKMMIDGKWAISLPYNCDPSLYKFDEEYCVGWARSLPMYYTSGSVIFVHAGINEEHGENWKAASTDEDYLWKYPAQTGSFIGNYKIVAGHVHTSEIAGSEYFNDIFFDGSSHYFIDGNVRAGGSIPVLKVNTETNEFTRVTKSGESDILPMDAQL